MNTHESLFYKTSQGEKRDKEILERYRIMIDYFKKNPDRIIGKNWSKLYIIFKKDVVLKNDNSLASLFEEVVTSLNHFINTSPSKKSSF